MDEQDKAINDIATRMTKKLTSKDNDYDWTDEEMRIALFIIGASCFFIAFIIFLGWGWAFMILGFLSFYIVYLADRKIKKDRAKK